MLSKPGFLEATRRYKNKKLNGQERQRYHALLLVTKGHSYQEAADILFVDEEAISRWAQSYQAFQKRGRDLPERDQFFDAQNHPLGH